MAGTAVERGAEARGLEMMAVAMVEAKRVLRAPYGDGAMGGGDGERVDASAWSEHIAHRGLAPHTPRRMFGVITR